MSYHTIQMTTDGCCEDLTCVPLATWFQCPYCTDEKKSGATTDPEAHELMGREPKEFLNIHLSRKSIPKFTCDQCGQAFVLLSVKSLDRGKAEVTIEPIETSIDKNGLIWVQGDEHIGFANTTDVTGTVLIVRKYAITRKSGIQKKTLVSHTVIGPHRLAKLLEVISVLDSQE